MKSTANAVWTISGPSRLLSQTGLTLNQPVFMTPRVFFLIGLLPLILLGWLGGPARAQTRHPLPGGAPAVTPEQTRVFAQFVKQAEANGQQLRKAANGITYIGIKPWVVANTSWSTNDILSMVAYLNDDFRGSTLQFYIVNGGIGTITAASSKTITYPTDEASLITNYYDATAINVYITQRVFSCSSTCTEFGGYSPSITDIYSFSSARPSAIANPNLTPKRDNYLLISWSSPVNILSQQMGFYFGLLRTSQGSDASSCADRERPIGTRTAGDTDRGDLIDDTDADPYPLYATPPLNATACTYTGSLLHCDATLNVRAFNPPIKNIMSDWQPSCLQSFSPHQLTRMPLLLPARLSAGNQYQLQNGVPGVSMAVSLTALASTGQRLTWNPVSGAIGYYVERSPTTDFSTVDVFSVISASASLIDLTFTQPLPASGRAYYRVRAINGILFSNVVTFPCPPGATLAGSQTVTNGQSATLSVALTGNPPWTVQVGGTTYANVLTSPFKVITPPYTAQQQTYTQTITGGTVTNSCGTAPVSGTVGITVSGTGTTGCSSATATLFGSYTSTAGQPGSIYAGLDGARPYSVTANGQVQTNITVFVAAITLTLTTPGTYTITPQLVGLAVANGCGLGQVGGTAVVLVQPVTNSCASMQTLKAGAWDDVSVWSCGRLPLLTDAVLIRHAVAVPGSYVAHAQTIGFDSSGKLSWDTNARLLLGL